MPTPNSAGLRPASIWPISLLALAGFIGLVYGSLAQTPIAVLGEIHRASRLTLVMSFPSFTAVGHFVAYAMAAAMVALVTPAVGLWPKGRRWQMLPYVWLALLAIGLEVAQQGTATRSFDWVDMIAGVAGVGIVAAPANLLIRVEPRLLRVKPEAD
ncbi:MAG: hypothetical protein ACTSX7_09740 [Alphaproteobacteria bacterium]